METVGTGDDSSLNIQNEYFNKARKGRTRITVVLTNGQRISGFIRSFDKFTLILDTRHGDQMVFKHAISTVSPSHSGDRDARGPRPPRSHGGERRHSSRPGSGGPKGGDSKGGPDTRQRAAASPQGKAFGNFMDLSAVSKSGEGAAEKKGQATEKPGPKADSGKKEPARSAKPASETETKPEAKSEPKAEAKTEPKPASGTETKPEAKSEPKAEAKPEPKPTEAKGGGEGKGAEAPSEPAPEPAAATVDSPAGEKDKA